jgi:hypothetical protein
MDFLEPPAYIAKMQEEAYKCDRVRFIEIAQAHQEYLTFLEQTDTSDSQQTWHTLAVMWVEIITELSIERFGEDITLDTSTVTVSYAKDITEGYKAKEVKWVDLYKLMTYSFNYSAGIFRDGYRDKAHWIKGGNLLLLDIDDGWTINEAMDFLEKHNLKSLIVTTKSHQKDKGGVACDRFRVALYLSSEIKIPAEQYEGMMKQVHSFFLEKPDPACKDVSRFYYPSPEDAEYYYIKGRALDYTQFIATKRKSTQAVATKNIPSTLANIVKYYRDNYHQGNRDNITFQCIQWAKDAGHSKGDIENMVRGIIALDPLPENQIRKFIKQINL